MDMTPGAIIDGVIIGIEGDRVIVHAGLKSEGVIPKSQFEFDLEEGALEPGRTVRVVLETVDDGLGETIMSREKARRAEIWIKLEDAHQNNVSVEGVINRKVKGGYTVDILGVRAFLPGSLVDMRPVREATKLEGECLDFKIIKIDQKRNNVVVSRRAVLEAENSAELKTLLDGLHEGQQLQGLVKNLTDYGAFIDLGGIDGLLHITDMAWHRVRHPSEVVELEQEITVQVLRFDPERNRISLGLKQLGEDPWVGLAERYTVNEKFNAVITNITEYGCFAELERGVEGLIHVSEMSWSMKNNHPGQTVNVGDEVEVMVLALEEGRRRISLGLRQCQPNPWADFADKHQVGDHIQGKINTVTDFGIFIGLAGDIDGLVHLSDISWDKPGEEAIKDYAEGDSIEVAVVSMNSAIERINLGIKQLQPDAFSDYLGDQSKGSVVTGKAVKIAAQQVTIELIQGVTATMRVADADSRKVVEDLRTYYSEGDEISAAITNIDRKKRTVRVSVKAMQIAEEARALESYRGSAKVQESAAGTIGDLIQVQMAQQQQTASDEEQKTASDEEQKTASDEEQKAASDESQTQEDQAQSDD